jgi:hypothetical protein
MTPGLLRNFADLRALNGLLSGAQIKQFLNGLVSSDPVLVIVTDRIHPDTGGNLTVVIGGFRNISVVSSTIRDAAAGIDA